MRHILFFLVFLIGISTAKAQDCPWQLLRSIEKIGQGAGYFDLELRMESVNYTAYGGTYELWLKKDYETSFQFYAQVSISTPTLKTTIRVNNVFSRINYTFALGLPSGGSALVPVPPYVSCYYNTFLSDYTTCAPHETAESTHCFGSNGYHDNRCSDAPPTDQYSTPISKYYGTIETNTPKVIFSNYLSAGDVDWFWIFNNGTQNFKVTLDAGLYFPEAHISRIWRKDPNITNPNLDPWYIVYEGNNGSNGNSPLLTNGPGLYKIMIKNNSGNFCLGRQYRLVCERIYGTNVYYDGCMGNALSGDCNGDGQVNAADLTATTIEINDGDGNNTSNAAGGTYRGTCSCDANKDGLINAADITCIQNRIFNPSYDCSPCTQTMINTEGFETGWGIWTDGGSDCARYNSTSFAASGAYSIKLADNSQAASSMWTSNMNLTQYSSVEVVFSFITSSFDNSNEDFWLQISTNGGSTYTTLREWDYSVHFSNNSRTTASVIVYGPFTSSTRFRLLCDASDDDDRLFIDNITIRKACPSFLVDQGNDTNFDKSASDDVTSREAVRNEGLPGSALKDLLLFPNPVSDELMLSFKAPMGKVQAVIRDLGGKVLLQQIVNVEDTGMQQIGINVGPLTTGMYLLQLANGTESVTKKFVVGK